MPFINARGIDFHYETYGDRGPQVLVAHGLMGSISMSASFGEDFAALAEEGLRVIAYDARGHGRSGYTTERADYRWAALAEDMRAIIGALGIEKISVYGGSMGAGTALMCALAHPDVVERLVVNSPPPVGSDLAPIRRQWSMVARLYRFFGSQATARILTSMPQGRGAQERNPRLDMRTFWSSQRRESIAPAIRGVLIDDELPIARFAAVEHHTLILTHPDEPLHPLASGEALHAVMPHAQLAVAPTADYWQTNASALRKVVAAFVKGEAIASGLPSKAHAHDEGISQRGGSPASGA
jgi:pimeloyl-ACP methyl ester carboxylesterase